MKPLHSEVARCTASKGTFRNSPLSLYRYAKSDARVDVHEQTSQVFTLARRAPSPVADAEAFWHCVAIASSRKERKLSPDPLRLKTSDGLQGMTRGRGWVKGGETAWVVLESNKLQDSGERE